MNNEARVQWKLTQTLDGYSHYEVLSSYDEAVSFAQFDQTEATGSSEPLTWSKVRDGVVQAEGPDGLVYEIEAVLA